MLGMQGFSRNFPWLDIRTSGATQGIFCDIRGPHFDNSGVDIAKRFQKLSDKALMQYILTITNRYACPQIP
jgi:hypothetical protein